MRQGRLGRPCNVIIALLNLFMRCAWALNYFTPSLFGGDPDQLVLFLQLVEVARRAMWNVLRVEWQCTQGVRESNK